MSTPLATVESDILTRLIDPENPSFDADGARSILDLRFAPSDIDRMNDLASQAREGSLSVKDEEELQGFLFVSAMVDLMHSKARISLKCSGT